MDEPSTVHPFKDSTLALGIEAQLRGYQPYFVNLAGIILKNGNLSFRCRKFVFHQNFVQTVHFLEDEQVIPSDEFNAVLMRKDPPFNMDYIFATHLLSFSKSPVINNPMFLRERPEKIYPLMFPGIFPETLISCDLEEIRDFASSLGEIILKPLDGNGGRGVVMVGKKDPNLPSLVEMLSDNYRSYIIAQRYLPEVSLGDKRVILIDGKPVGSVNRVKPHDDIRSNFHIGGTAAMSNLSELEINLCETISEQLKLDRLYFTGIDIIGDYITEINVTSPTGIHEIKKLSGVDIAKIFWDELDLSKFN